MTDLTGVVRRVLDRLPDVLADERARACLLTAASLLPRDFTRGPLGLEIRLAGPTVVDLFAAAIPGDAPYDALVRALLDAPDGAGWSDPAQARDLAEVLRRWERGEGALPSVARYLLVEVDAPAAPAGPVAVPSIFLAPRGHRDFPRPGQRPNAFHRFVDATATACAELTGVWPDPATAAALADVVRVLPADGDIFAVGAMVSRAAGASMRVAIRRLDVGTIHEVLCATGRPRQADLIAEVAATAPVPQHDIAFEVGPGAEERVGLELSPPHDWRSARTDAWPELLQFLVDRRLADPARADRVVGLVDPVGEPLWGLAHVKVAATAAGLLPVSKLYVGLMHRATDAP